MTAAWAWAGLAGRSCLRSRALRTPGATRRGPLSARVGGGSGLPIRPPCLTPFRAGQ